MAKNKGFRVSDTVVTNDDRDKYPVARSNDIEGGYHIYETENDMYTKISNLRRKIGMIVYCSSTEKWYKLNSHNPKSQTTTSSNWEEVFNFTKEDEIITVPKQVVFCFPKINSSTIEPEIFIPFEGKVVSIDASFSTVDNPGYKDNTDDIVLGFHHKKLTSDFFIKNSTITIQAGNFNIHQNLSASLAIKEELLKITLDSYPSGIKNLNVIVNMITEIKIDN